MNSGEEIEEESLSSLKNEAESAFSSLYKYNNRTPIANWEERRKLHLQRLKEKRNLAVDEKRDIDELFQDDECDVKNNERRVQKTVKKNPFRYKLMGSEWLKEIPSDLSENWLVKFCPQGVRFLVVANKGKTVCYYNNGKIGLKFTSDLPGGNWEINANRFTILDCVYDKQNHTFFVFDVLAWNSMSLINSEAQMRFYWIKSKFIETNIQGGKYTFCVVDFMPANIDLIQDYLFTPLFINEAEMHFEGVLFYHKEGLYEFSKSPLVAWLKTFMLTEILHIDVPEKHMINKPNDYICMDDYLNINKRTYLKPGNDGIKMEEGIEDEEFLECEM